MWLGCVYSRMACGVFPLWCQNRNCIFFIGISHAKCLRYWFSDPLTHAASAAVVNADGCAEIDFSFAWENNFANESRKNDWIFYYFGMLDDNNSQHRAKANGRCMSNEERGVKPNCLYWPFRLMMIPFAARTKMKFAFKCDAHRAFHGTYFASICIINQ